MTVIEDVHDVHGATYREVGGRRVVDHYGRPERVVRAVRNVVGVIEMGYGVVTVTGEDRVDFVDNAVSNRVPAADGEGCYALLLDPQGAIETEMYVYNAGERLLIFTAPDCAEPLVEDWQGKTFIQDVEIDLATDEFAVFGVHGPEATEKVASVLNGAATPERHPPLSAGRWSTPASPSSGRRPRRRGGVRGGLYRRRRQRRLRHAGEPGRQRRPFGYRTWETLTLEAGTPLFDTELEGRIP